MKKLLFTLFGLAIIGIACLSCNIGLGEAVDTQPPEVSITKPEVGAVIRDSFIIGGTWTDDGSIKAEGGLTVDLERTDDTGDKLSYVGTVGAEDWSCIIDPFDSSKALRDGEYQATITMTDTYEHKTVKTVTFTIDNTKPIVVLQRPSAKQGDTQPDSYGQTFSLTGQAADDNNIDLIEVNLYSDESCTTLLHTVKLENVPPTIELDVAKFVEGFENDYSKIYGSSSKDGTKQFYCQIVAYDGARRYPSDGSAQTEADKKGNSTDHYFLYEEISASILNDYKITEVYHMMNGNYTGGDATSRAATIASIKDTLANNETKTGFFSLNPANNPTFTVSGRENLKKDGTDFVGTQDQYISNGTSVIIEVAVGLDAIPLEASSLKVYAIECDVNGTVTGTEKLYMEGTQSKVGTTYKFVVPVTSASGLALGANYLFGVEGHDQKNNEVVASGKGYGFHFTSAGSAPDLFVTAPSGSTIYNKKGDEILFTGYIDVDDGLPSIAILDGTTEVWTKTFTAAERTITATERKEFAFTFTVPVSHFDQNTSADHIFTIKASNDGLSSTATKTIRYDVDDPTIEINEVSPIVSNTAHDNNINGTIKVKGSLADEFTNINYNDHATRWEMWQNGVKVDGLGADFTSSTFNFDIDTTVLEDKKDVVLKYFYEDASGNAKVKEVTYFVDQDTDIPTIESVDTALWSKTIDTKAKLQDEADAGSSLNSFSSKSQLSYTVTDDDGIARVTITEEGVLKNQSVTGNPKSLTMFYEVSEDSDQYELVFKIYDKFFTCSNYNDAATLAAAEAAPANAKHWYTFTICIQVTGAKPQITLNATPSCVTTNTTNISSEAQDKFTVSGTIGGVGPFKLTVDSVAGETHKIEYRVDGSTNYTEITKGSDGKYYFPEGNAYLAKVYWKDTFTPKAGTLDGTKTYKCFDKWNIYSSLDFNYEVDNERPSVNINSLSHTSPGYPSAEKTEQTQFTFRGTATDTNPQNMKKVEIQITEKGKACSDTTENTTDTTGWITADDLTSWNKAIYFNQYEVFKKESEKDIFLRVTDAAGNYNANYTTKVATFQYDKAQPVLALDNAVSSLPDGTYTLKGTITENYGFASGAKITIKEYFKEEGAAATTYALKGTKTPALTKGSDGKYTFSQTIPFDTTLSGDLKYVFSATDANGKALDAENGVTEMTATRDIVAPVLAVSVPSDSTYGENSIASEVGNFKGTVTESHKNKIYYQVKKASESAPTALTKANVMEKTDTEIEALGWEIYDISGLADDNWRITYPFDNDAATRDGKYKLYIQSADLGGNICAMKTQGFAVDSANPAITTKVMGRASSTATSDTELTAKLTGTDTIKVTAGDTYKLQGTVSDTNGIASFQVSIDGGDYTAVTVSNGAWTVNGKKTNSSDTKCEEGIHTYKFKAVDKSGKDSLATQGKVTETVVTVIFDLEDPTASITTLPSDGSWIYGTGNTYITGAAEDNSGIQSITVSLNGAAAETLALSNPWTYKLDCTDLDETTTGENPTKVHTLVVKVTDKCEKTTTITRTFYLDKSLPTISGFAYADSNTASKYTNNVKNVKISGNAFDGLKSGKRAVTLSLSATDGNGAPVNIGSPTITPGTDASDYGKFTDAAVSTVDLAAGEYTFKLTAKDLAGNTKDETFTVIVDKTAPTITNPKLDFGSTAENNKTIKQIKSAKVSLTPSDANLAEVFYYIDYGENTSITSADTVPTANWNIINKANGKYEKDISFEDGAGYVYLKVTDLAGNKKTSNALTFDIDTAAPNVVTLGTVDNVELGTNENKLTNASAKITVKINATDDNNRYKTTNSTAAKVGADATRVNSVKLVKIGDNTLTTPIAGTATTSGSPAVKTGEWTVEIPAATLQKWNGSTVLAEGLHTLVFEVADDAGNKNTHSLFTINKDTTPPTVTYADIIDADTDTTGIQVNGTIIISGTVTEANGIDSVKLEYKSKTDPETWTEVPHSNATVGTSSWTYEGVNTLASGTRSLGLADGSNLELRLVAKDKAGNTKTETKTLIIDQDTDRPVITLTTMALFNGTAASPDLMTSTNFVRLGTNSIGGTIADDDGTSGLTLKYKLNNADNWTPLTITGGIWKITDLPEAQNKIYFYVKDTAGKEFTSEFGTEYNQATPKITDNTKKFGYKTSSDSKITALNVLVDTINPYVDEVQYRRYGETVWDNSISSVAFGGEKNKFAIRQYVFDKNGIQSVTAVLEKKPGDKAGLADSYYTRTFEKKTSGTSTKTIGEDEYIEYGTKTNEEFDTKDLASGARNLTITVSDGLRTTDTRVTINVDNSAPDMTFESHLELDQVGTDFVLKGNLADGDIGSTVKCIINSSATDIATTSTAWDGTDVLDLEGVTALTWRLYFTKASGNGVNSEGYTETLKPKYWIEKLFNSECGIDSEGKCVKRSGGNLTSEPYTTVKTVYMHFLMKDSLGNPAIKKFAMRFDPQGEVPVIRLTYPEQNESGENKARLSGTIRLQGTAKDEKAIAGLYMQLDPSYNGTTFATNWDTKTLPKSGAGTLTSYTVDAKKVYDIQEFGPAGNKKKGIYIGKGTSWSYAINKYGEFNGTNNKIAIRLYAIDTDGNVSFLVEDDDFIIDIDSSAPRIGSSEPLYLYQFGYVISGTTYYAKSDDPSLDGAKLYTTPDFTTAAGQTFNASTTKAFKSLQYKDDMWLNGKWVLKGSLEDEGGIKTKSVVDENGDSVSPLYTAEKNWTSVGTKGNIFYAVVGNSTANSFGKLTYKIDVTDNTDTPNSLDLKINYDNKAPQVDGKGDDFFNICKNNKIVNSNGFYTLGSAAYESSGQSGFSRVVVYFTRGSGATPAIYDTYLAKTNGSTTNYNKLTTGYAIDANDHLPWLTAVTVSAIDGNKITLAANPNKMVHEGGLAKLAGTIYTIQDIDGKDITLDGSPAEGITSVQFAIGNVVDHQGAETAGTKANIQRDSSKSGFGYYTDSMDDDGDQMIETVSTSGTQTIWSATINSRNIPDGEIDIHYVVFDKAGNCTNCVIGNTATTTGDGNVKEVVKVENNAPRLVSVEIQTDYDGSGVFGDSADESQSAYFARKSLIMSEGAAATYGSRDAGSLLTASGNGKGPSDGGSAFMTVFSTVKFIPEIIGGNGQLKYTYAITASGNDRTKDQKQTTAQALKKADGTTNVNGYDEDESDYVLEDAEGTSYYAGHKDGVIVYKDSTDTHNMSKLPNGLTWFEYTIWDSTEGMTAGSNSLNAKMQICLNVKYNDTTPPKAGIRPFYWISKDSNSIAWDATTKAALGHIELEKDLTADIRTAFGDTATVRDPKVSGQIKVEGYAYDDVRIKEIYVQMADHTSLNTAKKVAEYGATGWTYTTGTGYNVEVANLFCNSNGHLAKWTVTIDTCAVGTGKQIAAKDRVIKVYATDKGSNSSADTATTNPSEKGVAWSTVKSTANADTTYYTDAYCTITVEQAKANAAAMGTGTVEDSTIVYANRNGMTQYYKVDVVPYITGIKSGLGSNNRSSNGHYQISASETGTNAVQYIGFNLAANNGNLTVTGIGTMATGEKSATVNSIQTLNNINDNTVEYNQQDTSTSKNISDNVNFDMWQFNSKAVRTTIDHAMISQPVMKYNSTTGNLGFAFSDGPNLFTMANGTSNSYEYWEKNYAKYVQSNFVFDNSGNSIGISVGIDTYPEANSCKSGRMNLFTSIWGTGGRTDVAGNFNGSKSIHLDAIGEGDQDIREDRFSSIAMALAEHSDRTLYIAYYDQKHSRIIFRWGLIKDSKDNTNVGTDNNQLRYRGNEGAEKGFALNANDYSIIANGTGTGKTGYNAGEYVDLAVIPGTTRADDTVCAVWFTGSDLMYSYKTAPCNDYDLSTTTTSGHWSTPEKLLENGGKFCKIRTDANGGIHVATFDGSCNGVTYLYKPSYNSSTTNKVVVDALNGPYDEIFLDVALDSNSKAVPSISYYANGKVKMAVYKTGITKTTGVPEQSWEDGAFNAKWDVCFVPTTAVFSKADHINVALPKNTSGTLTNVQGTGVKGFTETGASQTGTVGGNGTLNPILGYAIYNQTDTQGYIEIAQRK